MMEEQVNLKVDFLINLASIIAGKVDGRISKHNGKYPTQVVYYDNLFRTNSKEKTFKIIKN